LTGMATGVPPYETFSLIINNILHQSKLYKNHFENSKCLRYVTFLYCNIFVMTNKVAPDHWVYPDISGVCVNRFLALCVCFVDRCLAFLFWLLCCLSSFDLRILITPLLSSNSSYARNRSCALNVISTFIWNHRDDLVTRSHKQQSKL
jgi:hypothetical protein